MVNGAEPSLFVAATTTAPVLLLVRLVAGDRFPSSGGSDPFPRSPTSGSCGFCRV